MPTIHRFSLLTSGNSESYYSIHAQVQFTPWSRKVFDDCLTPPYFAYCLHQLNQPIGYYIGMAVLDEATLMDIGVSQSYQGKGKGKILLQHFIQQCQQQNLSHIWLEVRASNTPAIKLYQTFGFELIEKRKNYYPTATGKEDALMMKMTINIKE